MSLFDVFLCVTGVLLAVCSTVPAACISDSDSDGVCDNVDLCPDTVLGAPVDSTGCPFPIPGDFDRDGDVDLDDLAILTPCASGPAVPASDVCQAGAFDFDFDTDVDMDDFGGFQRCFSGANHPADPGCMSHSARIVDGCLRILGTVLSSDLAIRLQPGVPTVLQVDVGNDGSADFSFDRSQFDCIVIDAGGGDDIVWIDEQNGVFTDTESTRINGGNAHDTLLGGSGSETFDGGRGNDSIYMGIGNDHVVWNPGGDTDFIEGGGGADTVEVNGDDGSEVFTIMANGQRVRFDRGNPDPFFLDIGTCESFILNANGGNDSLSCTGNLAALIQITADGGAGDDSLLGSNGSDVLMGGADNDFVDGNQGNDVAFLGAGDDVFQWDPGDGSDTIEGQADGDELLFNGSGANEIIDLFANGARLTLLRNVGTVTLDADGVEQVNVNALGGTDAINATNLAGTAVTQVNVDLAGILGGNAGDGWADTVTVNGTAAPDVINITANAGAVQVSGLAASVWVTHPESALDALIVNGLGGVDTITTGAGVTSLIMVSVNQ